ncbi:NAD(P)-dependent alcohol dehydrogenase [Cellulomonas sp. C5510]|uniref:NAD(P)-dependent alcohol dehydrogenase n=1 Tax=Cellulomonas sp. C5510 TaxID=2871170 RepID=UPI001C97F2F5|nr:NAD(P)-dependent alcohol dehydrogenase [Cellulomonas sp. C5510]QZN84981.1 NAD(P)-dependent alcohol dehydrogenase [Cellulomonas sp. C5510]
MRAVVRERYGDSSVLQVVQRADPPAPVRDQVLVEVGTAGVNMADWHLMTGLPSVARLVFGVRAPREHGLGRDLAGVVRAVGPEVASLRPGDAVLGTAPAAFAELALTRERALARIPDGVRPEHAAAVPTAGATALHALRAARVGQGSRLLVLGAGGGVGSLAVRLAVLAGARVTAATSPGKAATVRALGPESVVDRSDRSAWGTGYDGVVVTGGLDPLRDLRRLLAPRGALALVGAEGGGDVLGGGTTRQLRAALLSPFVRQRLVGVVSRDDPAALARLCELLADGSLVPAVERVLPLEGVAEAIDHLASGAARGKVLLGVSSPAAGPSAAG